MPNTITITHNPTLYRRRRPISMSIYSLSARRCAACCWRCARRAGGARRRPTSPRTSPSAAASTPLVPTRACIRSILRCLVHLLLTRRWWKHLQLTRSTHYRTWCWMGVGRVTAGNAATPGCRRTRPPSCSGTPSYNAFADKCRTTHQTSLYVLIYILFQVYFNLDTF